MISRLPLIVGFGGYNAAGRSSMHHGFRRTVLDALDSHSRQETLAGLAVLMQLIKVTLQSAAKDYNFNRASLFHCKQLPSLRVMLRDST